MVEAVEELSRLITESILWPQGLRRKPGSPEKGRRGPVVLVGGLGLPDEAVLLSLRLAGGRESRVAVWPLASPLWEKGGERFVRAFRRFGAENVTVVPPGREGHPVVAGAEVIAVVGGSPGTAAARLREGSLALLALAAHRRGAVLLGVGAGAEALGPRILLPEGEAEGMKTVPFFPLATPLPGREVERLGRLSPGEAAVVLPSRALATFSTTGILANPGRQLVFLASGRPLSLQPLAPGEEIPLPGEEIAVYA